MPDQTEPPRLSSFLRNVYSQNGEDGIIEEILGRLSSAFETDHWCVEFGALDGISDSNTYNLIKNANYKAVLIEFDPKNYEELCRNIPSPAVIKLCQFVSFDGELTLDRILAQTPIPKNFDFLSIDIDGCDYFVFESSNEICTQGDLH